MYKEIKLVKYSDKNDKIYVKFNHFYYYIIFKSAPNQLIKYQMPQVTNIAFKDSEMSLLLVIKKDTFKPVYELLEKISDILHKLEKLDSDELQIAYHLGTTDKDQINKMKEFKQIFNDAFLNKNTEKINNISNDDKCKIIDLVEVLNKNKKI